MSNPSCSYDTRNIHYMLFSYPRIKAIRINFLNQLNKVCLKFLSLSNFNELSQLLRNPWVSSCHHNTDIYVILKTCLWGYFNFVVDRKTSHAVCDYFLSILVCFFLRLYTKNCEIERFCVKIHLKVFISSWLTLMM